MPARRVPPADHQLYLVLESRIQKESCRTHQSHQMNLLLPAK